MRYAALLAGATVLSLCALAPAKAAPLSPSVDVAIPDQALTETVRHRRWHRRPYLRPYAWRYGYYGPRYSYYYPPYGYYRRPYVAPLPFGFFLGAPFGYGPWWW